MKEKLFEKLFSFHVTDNLKISVTKNEIYNELLLYIFSCEKKNLLLLAPTLNEANKIYFTLKKYYDEVYIFPEDEYLTKKAIASSPDLIYMRIKLLQNISNAKNKIVICHPNSYIKKLPNPKEFFNYSLNLALNQTINRDEIVKKLINIGYKKDTTVTNTGEFAVRGFVLDVFPFDYDHPIRIEFFDDEIEEIKLFDEFTQLTINKVKEVKIFPVKDEFNCDNYSVLDYLDNPIMIVQDQEKVNEALHTMQEEAKYYDEYIDVTLKKSQYKNIFIDTLNNVGNYDLEIKAEEINNYNEKSETFIKDIIKNKGTLYSENDQFNSVARKNNINIVKEYLNKGFCYEGKYYYSINDLKTNTKKENYNFKYKVGSRISSIDNLTIGDYIVHKDHGIGVYQGIKTISKAGLLKDYILIQYKDSDKLYIPVDKLDKIYKYSSKEGTRPNIQKLNSTQWDKTKSLLKKKIKDISLELINLYKERASAKTVPYETNEELEKSFGDEFDYTLTLDQAKSIKEIEEDLVKGKPMDRLLCGDVGYGKTEVIFRTMFKTVINNYQVLYLCPTTLLSKQQYDNAIKRFKNYGVNIALLNRHTTMKETKKILEDLKEGKIDILFGTHRLLSDDINPKKLGLLVVDEEQRFGVAHKEKIKKYKNNIHILSVSATPIPRSLQMSLTGIKDLSLIETAPKNRYPVQTYVIEYNDILLKNAVEKEIARNGQVFILYNKISNMDELASKYEKLIPGARIKYAHGKMQKEEIQDIMNDFYLGKYDVLISTTIIENGIDVPNANTIIVMDANNFGLSQLYQIRGRVGRSEKIAYAYLMYNKRNLLTETAEKRLNAIKEFTELGSGYKISMRDLSIRGAGDLLGPEQSGFIDSVGVNLYLELINEEFMGTESAEEVKSEIYIDSVDTHIDKKYTENDELIIELHDKINSIDSIEKLEQVKREVIDLYGFIDTKLEEYMVQELVEKMLIKLNISIMQLDKSKFSLKVEKNIYSKLSIEDLFVEATKLSSKITFNYRNDYIIISIPKLMKEKNYLYYVLNLLIYIKEKANI